MFLYWQYSCDRKHKLRPYGTNEVTTMNTGALYAELLQHEFEARFASPEFQQRASYFAGLKARVLRRSSREHVVQRVPAAA